MKVNQSNETTHNLTQLLHLNSHNIHGCLCMNMWTLELWFDDEDNYQTKYWYYSVFYSSVYFVQMFCYFVSLSPDDIYGIALQWVQMFNLYMYDVCLFVGPLKL